MVSVSGGFNALQDVERITRIENLQQPFRAHALRCKGDVSSSPTFGSCKGVSYASFGKALNSGGIGC